MPRLASSPRPPKAKFSRTGATKEVWKQDERAVGQSCRESVHEEHDHNWPDAPALADCAMIGSTECQELPSSKQHPLVVGIGNPGQ